MYPRITLLRHRPFHLRFSIGRTLKLALAALGVWVTASAVLIGPASASPEIPTVELTHEQIAALLSTFPKTGEQVKVMGIGNYNVAVSLQRRNAVKLGAPVSAISHSRIAEIYYIVSGSGTMVVDGTRLDPKPMDPAGDVVAIDAGPSMTGIMTGGLSRNVSAGDVIMVPPNTPHGWSQIDDQVSYVMFRTDPDKVLPAGWVNPNLKDNK
jgi:mannose-6-phosphate isomerase-like protein (cupin superfamily)